MRKLLAVLALTAFVSPVFAYGPAEPALPDYLIEPYKFLKQGKTDDANCAGLYESTDHLNRVVIFTECDGDGKMTDKLLFALWLSRPSTKDDATVTTRSYKRDGDKWVYVTTEVKF